MTAKLLAADVTAKSGQTPIDSQYMSMLERLEERAELMSSDFSTNANPWEHEFSETDRNRQQRGFYL